MEFTIESLKEQLQIVQQLKLQLLQGGLPAIQKPDSWRVGEVSFSGGGSKAYIGLKDLLDMEQQLMEMMRTMFPSTEILTLQDGVNPFGVDSAEYVNEGV